MKKTMLGGLLIISVSSIMCSTTDKNKQGVETILMDTEYLAMTKASLDKNDLQFKKAFDQLLKDAEAALYEGPFSVTDKTKVAPSGDKHDYASYSRYWWPDPDKVDGLPYIRRDGETNPASQSLEESDRPRIGSFGINTETLGLAYYFTGEDKYANKAAELLKVWFLDSLTYMNPNVNHAQCRIGHNNGTKSGVLDGRQMIRALEGSLLISNSSALSATDYKELKAWSDEYFEWLTTNEMALEEAASKNNHGSFYDLQAIYFALYSGNRLAATQVAEKFTEHRILKQIKPNGSMPEEVARTRPLFYSIYNLHAMFLVAKLAEKVHVDVWDTGDKDSRLRVALDYLVPYTDPSKVWPSPTIGEADRIEMLALLQMANRVYSDGNYLEITKKLPAELRTKQRTNLAFPLMR